jgi:CDI toxin RNase A-like protein
VREGGERLPYGFRLSTYGDGQPVERDEGWSRRSDASEPDDSHSELEGRLAAHRQLCPDHGRSPNGSRAVADLETRLPEIRALAEGLARPGRDIAADLYGEELRDTGHTLELHVGKSDQELARRLEADDAPQFNSAFTDTATAAEAVGTVLGDRRPDIDRWLDGEPGRTGDRIALDAYLPFPTGRSVSRTDATDCHGVRVVLRRDDRDPRGYVIRTAYPRRDDELKDLA